MSLLNHFLTSHPLLAMAVTIILGQAGMPIASAPMLLLIGALTGSERVGIPLALFVTVSACVFVDCAWFDLGRNRKSNPGRAFKRLQSADSRSFRIAHFFARHRVLAILMARFLPGPNLVAALAGLSGLSRLRFVLLDIIASGLWAILYLVAGRFLPNQLRTWFSSTLGASPVCGIIPILGFGAVLFIASRFGLYLSRRRTSPLGVPALLLLGVSNVCLTPDL